MAPSFAKLLSRLNRDRLIDLCLEWVQSPDSKPYLASNRSLFESDEEDYLHEPATSLLELQRFYSDLRQDGATSRRLSKKDIIDRIVDGDWRRGLTLSQIASIDLAYLEQCDTAHRWTALELVPLDSAKSSEAHPEKRQKLSHERMTKTQYPDITPVMFLKNLKRQISPLVRAYYTLATLKSYPNITILRMQILTGVPFTPAGSSIIGNNSKNVDISRVMYIALPQSSRYIYVSVATIPQLVTASRPASSSSAGANIVAAKKFVLEAVPKAFSRPQERWMLESTKLTARSLRTMRLMRGMGQCGSTGGAYSHFADPCLEDSVEEGTGDQERPSSLGGTVHARPTHVQLMTPPPEETLSLDRNVQRRFGIVSGTTHAPLSRFSVRISNLCQINGHISLRVQGSCEEGAKKRKRSSSEHGNGSAIQQADKGTLAPRTTDSSSSEPAALSLSFSGSDIFAGLKQLATSNPEYFDISVMPSWMTGERGVSTLTI